MKPTSTAENAAADRLFAHGGEMGELMKRTDWGATPVGPVEQWPQSLRSAIRILLECRHPMYLAWGREHIQFYNDAYRPILGDKHPALGRSARETWDEIWPTIGPMWQEVWAGNAMGFDDFRMTIRRFGYDEECWFSFSYSPLRDDDDEVAGVLVTVAETTKRVQSERRLIEERERLRSIFMQAAASIAIFRGPDHIYEFANPPYLAMLGRTSLVGQKVREALPEIRDSGIYEILDNVYQTGAPFVVAEYEVPIRMRPDGEPEPCWFSFSLHPLRDEQGQIFGQIAVAIDVTAQVHARRKLEALTRDLLAQREVLLVSERRFRELADAMPQIVWTAQADGRIDYFNERWYAFSKAARDLDPAWTWQDAVHPDDLPRVVEAWARSVATGNPYEIRCRLRDAASGAHRWHLVRALAVRDAGGSVTRWHGTATDIHDQQLAEAELRAARSRLDLVTGATDLGVWYCDLPFDELIWNPQVKSHFWLPPDARVTIDLFFARLHPDDREPTRVAIDYSIAERSSYDVQYRTVNPADGRIKWIRAIGRAFYGNDGAPTRFDGITIDVTTERAREQALREAEERFRSLTETMPQLVWITGADGKLTWVNQHWSAYVGATMEQSRSEAWAGVFHPDDHARTFTSWQEAQKAASGYTLELRMRRRADGSYRWFLIRAVPLREKDGAVSGWIGVATDIEDLKQAEERVRAAAERERERQTDLRLALEAGKIGTWEVFVPEQKVLFDARGANLFGLPRAGRWDLAWLISAIHPDDQQRVAAAIQHSLDPASRGEYDIEYRTIGIEDGVLRWVRANGQAAFAADGTALRFTGMIVDLTEAKRATLRDRVLVEAGAVLMGSLDERRILADLARLCVERLVDWCAIDIVDDKGAIERVATQHRDPAKVEMANELVRRYPAGPDSPSRRVVATGESVLIEHIPDDAIDKGARDAEHAAMIRALGLRSIVCVPLRTRDRILGGITLVTAESQYALDRSDLEFVEGLAHRAAIAIDNARLFAAEHAARTYAADRAETLSRLNAELEQFAYVCSHDLQEPLRMITQYMSILKRDMYETLPPRSRQHMDHALDGGFRIQELVRDLLAYSRVARDAGELVPATPLDRPLREALDNVQLAAANVGATITSDPLPSACVDRVQLVLVFQNLLENAIKFRRPDVAPRIHVSATQSRGSCEIAVSDNGIGIAPQHTTRIFDVFQRLHARNDYPGTGIGLAVCKRIVERFGGRIWVEGNQDGGSTFRFTLPSGTGGNEDATATHLED